MRYHLSGSLCPGLQSPRAICASNIVSRQVDFLPEEGPVFQRLINNAHCPDIVRFVPAREAIESQFSAT